MTDERARDRMISTFDLATSQPEFALAFRFDIVLRGHGQTVFEGPRHG